MKERVIEDPGVLSVATEQAEMLSEGCVEVVPKEGLSAKLAKSIQTGVPLRVKLGIDPTGSHVHIGHAVVYRKIRQFQDLGHTAVLIIGDYTARIGDPTDLDGERPPLSKEQVEDNASTYTDLILKVVREDRAEIRHQSEWFDGYSLEDVIRLNAHFSLAHMLSHETFRKRMAEGNRLSLHEIFYPVLQACDSVKVQADIEIGGTDQTFNCLCGRDLMKTSGMEPQIVMTSPLLPGIDGRKMSKSFGNDVSLREDPDEMYGKIMSIADALLPEYLRHVSGLTSVEVAEVERRIAAGSLHPMEAKKDCAFRTVEHYHGAETALAAQTRFEHVFSNRSAPEDIQEYHVTPEWSSICDVLTRSGAVVSTSEVRRLIKQRGIKVDGEVISDIHYRFDCAVPDLSFTVKIGKRRFLKVVSKGT